MSDALTVGAGSVVVDPDALDAAAGVLAQAAADVAACGAGAAAVALDPALLLSVPLAPATGVPAERALGELLLGPAAATPLAARVLLLAGLLRTASLRYRVGEDAAAAAVQVARRAAAEAVVQAAPALAAGAAGLLAADVALRTAQAGDLVLLRAVEQVVTTGELDLQELGAVAAQEYGAVDDRVLGDARRAGLLIARHPWLVQEAVATTPAVVRAAAGRSPLAAAGITVLAPQLLRPDAGAAEVAGALTAVGALSPLFRETSVRVSPAARRAVPTRPPRGVAEVLDGVAHQSTGFAPDGPAGSVGDRMPVAGRPEPGVVRLERVTQAGGSVAWIVQVPGTQDWTPLPSPGATPMDLTTNLRVVAGEPTATTAAVAEAMRRAGVGAGEPVMLAGHSQGGLTVTALAADAGFRERYRVTHVVTAGSPVDGFAVPGHVRVLSLEHTGDLVPALDGTAARPSASRTVVRRDVGDDPDFADAVAGDPLTAHGWRSYLDTAALVDASTDEALVGYRDSAAAFFDAPGARVEVFDYRAERV
ncbi:alpha/beta hydrolase family protein [Kineococcus esterisolvens]|uniref:hypothetical protein n=1 Tax=unclassified Kineococcus TaxID=2621656 RepID=UPI003D7E53ED